MSWPGVLDERTLEPRAHPVALRQELVRPLQEGRDARRGEPVVLRPEDHGDGGLGAVDRHLAGPQPAGAGRHGGAQRQPVAPAQRAAPEAAQAAAHVGRARAEHDRGLETAGHRQVGAHPAPGRAEPQHVARLHRHRLPGRHRRAVHGRRHVGPGHRDQAIVGQLDAGADHGTLQRGGAVRVADEPVGEHERVAIHRARGRDADPQVSEAAEVLDGGERARLLDEQVAHEAAPVIRGA